MKIAVRPKSHGALLLVALLATSVGCARERSTDQVKAGEPQRPATAPVTLDPVRDWPVPESAPGGRPYGSELQAELGRALAIQPAGYLPRTHHIAPAGSPLYTNRLILENSPYLRQHAHNPVDWYPWGEEAFEAARALGRPVLLSVGYSTCHWCHVMERESFEDLEIARFINEHYIAVKVDREERPDVDAVYMDVLQMVSGRGGWPMTVVLTPDRQPLFSATYIPARDGDRGARMGFLTILMRLEERWRVEGAAMVEEAAVTTRRLQALAEPAAPGDLPDLHALEKAVRDLSDAFDPMFGGFGGAPKFPRPATLEFLLRYHRRTRDAQALHMAVYTLERMAAGGLRDHVGGGFHRYSTDPRWLVPHFEKMLYDNAQLASAYLEAYQVTGREDFAAIAAETLDYVAREMTGSEGGFYSASDADSAGPEGIKDEGRFFTWTPTEIREVVDARDADMVIAFFGVSETGNFENRRSILHTATSLDTLASKHRLTRQDAERRIAAARAALYDARSRRPPPETDTKVISAWNGLMLSVFARGALILRRADYGERARAAAEFIASRLLRDEVRLHRAWKSGHAKHEGVLEDYAFVIAGLLDLFELRPEARWLELVIRLQSRLDDDFADEIGGYFFTAEEAEKLLVRTKSAYDGAIPSGNAVAVGNLLRLAEWTGEDTYRSAAEAGLRAFAQMITTHPTAVPKMLCALDFYLDSPKEIVIVAPEHEADTSPFVDRTAEIFMPNRILVAVQAGARAGRLAAMVPLLQDKVAVNDMTTAYVCEKRVCKKPTTDPEEFVQQIATVRPYPSSRDAGGR